MGDKKKGKGKKAAPSTAESLIQFEVDVKKKEIEELKKEIGELEANVQKTVEQRDQLRKEQEQHFSVLHKQGSRKEEILEEKEVASISQQEQAIQENLELAMVMEQELEMLDKELTSLQARIVELQVQQETWQLYEAQGSVEHQQKIQKLQLELEVIQKNLTEMTEHIDCSLKAAIDKIDHQTSQLIEEEQQLAREKALKHADKHSIQKMLKNDWLKKELAAYREELVAVEHSVSKLEEKNLEHTKQLIEYRLNDLQISRNKGLTQEEPLHVDGHAMPLNPLPCDPEDLETLTKLGVVEPRDPAIVGQALLEQIKLYYKKEQ